MLLLVDGSNMAFRAHCAYPPLTDSEGRPCGAIFGMLRLLRSLVASYPEVSRVVVAFDISKSDYRQKLYPQYKAQRAEQPDRVNRAGYLQQVPYLLSILGLLVPVVAIAGVEADDVISWLANTVEDNVTISSTDRDLYQLVSHRVKVVDAFRRETDKAGQCEITPDNFVQVTGCNPEQYLEMRAMIGDTSDNIKGIVRVGPKTAAKLVKDYGSLDAMLAAKVKVVVPNEETVRRNLKLMTLNLHTIQPELFADTKVQLSKSFTPKLDVFGEVLEALSFKSLAHDLTNWAAPFRALTTAPIFNPCDCKEVDADSSETVPALSSEADFDGCD